MKKIEAPIWQFEEIRILVAKAAPEMVDLQLRFATAKATVLATFITGVWVDRRAAIYVTEAEWSLIERLIGGFPELLASKYEDARGPATNPGMKFDERARVDNRKLRAFKNDEAMAADDAMEDGE